MNVLPLLVTAGGCLLYSVTVFVLRDRLHQPGRNTGNPTTGNDLPFDRAA